MAEIIDGKAIASEILSGLKKQLSRLGISPRTLRYKLARLRDPMPGGMVALGEGAV